MRKTVFSIVVTLVVLSSFAVNASAQNRLLARTKIPFAFSAEGQQLTAGDYEVSRVNEHTMLLRNVATGKGLFLPSPTMVSGDTVKLVFRVYGTDHFLGGVVAPSDQISLAKSKSERQVEASVATTETVGLGGK